MISIFIVLLTIIIIALGIVVIICFKEEEKHLGTIVFTLITIGSIFLGGMIEDNTSIPAIDVYRGKTTLEINETKVDSTIIKRDSTVIYINK